MSEHVLSNESAELDTRRKYVRITGRRGDEFIEFDFAIGEPDIFVEMILTPEAFEEFCNVNQVEPMPEPEKHSADSEEAQWDWRLADATQVRFKN